MTEHIDVVVPALDAAHTLPEAIASVHAQTWSDRVGQIIVVDDGSRDDTANVAAGLGAVVASHDEPLGAGPARNTGVTQFASAPIVAFLDADDVWRRTHLEAAVRELDASPHVAGVLSPWVGAPRDSGRPGGDLLDPVTTLLTLDGVPGCSGWVLRRRAFEACDGFDPAYRRFQDYELAIRMTAGGFPLLHLRTGHFDYRDSVHRRRAWSAASARSLEQLALAWGLAGRAEAIELMDIDTRRRVATSTLLHAAHVHASAGNDAELKRIMSTLRTLEHPKMSPRSRATRFLQVSAGRHLSRPYGFLVRRRNG